MRWWHGNLTDIAGNLTDIANDHNKHDEHNASRITGTGIDQLRNRRSSCCQADFFNSLGLRCRR